MQCTLVIVNAWIVNNLSFMNIFGETGLFLYNINYMLNSEHLSLVNKIGDKTEFTITRVHCIKFMYYYNICSIPLLWECTTNSPINMLIPMTKINKIGNNSFHLFLHNKSSLNQKWLWISSSIRGWLSFSVISLWPISWSNSCDNYILMK